MNKQEREIQLADMHDNGVRFSETLKAKKKGKEERLKKIEAALSNNAEQK